jgi:hypothetical protein
MAETRLKIKGLYSLQNPYSEVPEGALEVADNVVIDRDSIASPRRGFEALANNFASPSDRAHSLYEFQGKLISHYSTNKMAYFDSGWNNYSGTYAAPDSTTKIYSTQANSNFYFLTNEGVKKLDSFNGTVSDSGVPKALGGASSLVGSGSLTSGDDQYAYRVVWGIRDANDNVILSAPSQRIVVTDSSTNPNDIQLVIDIPVGITTSHFIQLYRTATSGDSAIDPGDEMGLIYETFPSGSDITAKQITLVDVTPDELRGATLYTSPSQEGVLSANDQPPAAKDIAVFKGYTFYANTTGKHRYTITLLGVDGDNGLELDDEIEIGSVTYTCKATEDIAAAEFEQFTAGSASQNIRDTALSLVNVINQHASNTEVYAYYLSGPDDLPGKILLEARELGGSAFTVTTDRATAWSPDATGGEDSSNDRYENGIFISKFQEPEAVPLTNIFRVGSASDPILRIIPLRASILIFKEKEGIYRLTGEDLASFQIDLLTSSTRLLAKNTAAVLNNQIYALTDQGVAAITENNVQIISRPIEDKLLELYGANLTSVKDMSWAVAYESDRKYIINIISASADQYTTQAFVWNVFTSTWTRWPITRSCGLVRPSDNKLYVGDAIAPRVSFERKGYSFRDTADEAIAVTVSNVDDTTLTITNSDQAAIGDVYYESDSAYGIIEAVDTAAGTITLNYDAGFSTGSGSILKAFNCRVKWVPFTSQEPMMGKQFREVSLVFDKDFASASIIFTSELSQAQDSVSVTGTEAGLFGLFPFGEAPFGGDTPRHTVRTYVPLEKQRAAQLSVEFQTARGYNDFRLAGAQVVFNPTTEKVTR